MSLADALANPPATKPENVGRVDVGADGGEFTDVVTDAPVSDWANIFSRFNLDPLAFTVDQESVRMSTWQQSKRLANGQRDIVNLFSYRARFTRKTGLEVDLPALYAEVRRTKAKAPKPVAGDVTTVVSWADIQCGKTDKLGGTRELLQRLDDKRVALERYLKTANSSAIVIADVGDIIENFSNVKSQIRTNDLSLMDQVDVAATELWKTIRLCAKYAPVTMISVASNHGQWREGSSLLGKPDDDWGLHINRRLERMNDEIGLNVTFKRPEEWRENVTHRIGNTVLGVTHGHQAGKPENIAGWWAKQSHSGNLADVSILLHGHFHYFQARPSGRDANSGRSKWILGSPTLDSGSSWVANSFGEDGDPALLVFGVDPNGFKLNSLNLL